MSELRQNRVTGVSVIIAPERSNRPQRRAGGVDIPPPRLSFDPECPFCPGNEAMLPSILENVPADGPPGWKVRVVPNKYPALTPDAAVSPPTRYGGGAAGYGHHEVVIESPRHDAEFASMSEGEIAAVLSVYHLRFVWLSKQRAIDRVILFRNHGSARGASLVHPHAQLVALPMTPPDLQTRAALARSWYERYRRCVLCDEMDLERADGRRVIGETESFTALVPFAATCPFEVWIVPRRHQASFAEIGGGELGEAGLLLRDVLCRLKSALGDPPYNFVVDSAGPAEAGSLHLHWYVRIAPGLATPGGFELATGMSINPSSPEGNAQTLRSAESRSGSL